MECEILRKVRKSWSGKGTTGQFKFHNVCGSNIAIRRNTIAYRKSGFSNGLCFSHCPLLPGQLFLIEISDAQDGWSGHLRVGVTQHNPSLLDPVPEMAIPDMTTGGRTPADQETTTSGQTWAKAITKFHNRIRERNRNIIGWPNDDADVTNKHPNCVFFANQRLLVNTLYFLGRKELTYTSTGSRFPDFGQSVFVGSRIGVTLVPVSAESEDELRSPEEELLATNNPKYTHCNMHFIINGEDQGPCETGIPLDKPLYALVDVYSTTTQVKIIPLTYIGDLKDLARDAIRSIVSEKECNELPLPATMKTYCQYK